MKDSNEFLQGLRQSYSLASLDIQDCASDPLTQFKTWMDESIKSQCDEPNAFVFSSIEQSRPRSRVVLLKGIHNGEFVFYTNYQSDKGHEVETNPHVCMNFLWLPLQRQVRIEGTISKVSVELSENYFHKRPRGSQLGAIASPQSKKMKSRDELETLFKDAEKKFEKVEVLPRPSHWGGYQIKPQFIEFWQGRDNRMHDRICFELKNGQWETYRVAP